MDGTVLTCRLHQSRPALLPVAVLHHLEEKCVRVRACCGGRVQRTSVMHDVPRYLLHQVLERDLCEFRWKDILGQVRITFSNSVTRAQYWHLHLRATVSRRHRVHVSCGSHVAVLGMTGRASRTSGRFGCDGESERQDQWPCKDSAGLAAAPLFIYLFSCALSPRLTDARCSTDQSDATGSASQLL
jgi:hypothetical protein